MKGLQPLFKPTYQIKLLHSLVTNRPQSTAVVAEKNDEEKQTKQDNPSENAMALVCVIWILNVASPPPIDTLETTVGTPCTLNAVQW